MEGFKETDWRLMHKLQEKLSEPYYARLCMNFNRLAALKQCMRHSGPLGVTVKKNNNGLTLNGVLRCNNSSGCPICSAYKQARMKKKLIAIFKSLKKQGYTAFMATFVVPNLKYPAQALQLDQADANEAEYKEFYTFDEIFTLLKASQQNFMSSKSFRDIKKAIGADYSFFTTETTYTKHGWHPHTHFIYWVPKENLNKVLDYEKRIRKLAQNAISRMIDKLFANKPIKKAALQKLTNERNRKLNVNFFISKNPDNSIMEATHSNYFWSAAHEMLNLKIKRCKASTSRTIWDLLKDGLDNNDEAAFKRYVEYMMGIAGHSIYRLSKGLDKIANDWLAENAEELMTKKNRENTEQLCWFNQQQWNYFNRVCPHLKILLANFCRHDNTFELIKQLCEVYDIPIAKEPPYKIAARTQDAA